MQPFNSVIPARETKGMLPDFYNVRRKCREHAPDFTYGMDNGVEILTYLLLMPPWNNSFSLFVAQPFSSSRAISVGKNRNVCCEFRIK